MEKLISTGVKKESVPESYILPPNKRPGNDTIRPCQTIPAIDLEGADGNGCNQAGVINQILKASEEFGFFQLVNHGVPPKCLQDMISIAKEFFKMPPEDRAGLYSDDPNQIVRVYTSIDYNNEDVHYWKHTLRHPCYPIEKFMPLWPRKPCRYRDVTGKYTMEVRALAKRILELLSQGLGLEKDYFSNELSRTQLMAVNHYPTCPDPSLTLGLPRHCDPNLITFLLQGEVCGLQVFKDGEWIAVEALPNSFVVNLGHQMEIITNGQLKAVEHRVVTNTTADRTTIATFIYPDMDCVISPAPVLVNEQNPPLSREFRFQEFLGTYMKKTADKESVIEAFKFHDCCCCR